MSMGKSKVDPAGVETTSDVEAASDIGHLDNTHRAEHGKFQQILVCIVDNKIFTVIMAITTVYALFGDDCRLAMFPKAINGTEGVDETFWSLSIIALVLFIVEFILNCCARPQEYIKPRLHVFPTGFYFWLDLVAALSIIPDIGWIAQLWTSGDASALKAGRASRAGTKAGRVVRIVRLVRLVRIVKIIKFGRNTAIHDDGDDEEDQPSHLGNQLAETITRSTILLVLLMLFILPIFDGNLIDDSSDTYQPLGFAPIHRYNQDWSFNSSVSGGNAMKFAIQKYAENCDALSTPVMRMEVFGMSNSDVQSYLAGTPSSYSSESYITTERRVEELLKVEDDNCFANSNGASTGNTCVSTVWLDNRSRSQLNAWLSICKTFFVMIVLGLGACIFQRDANILCVFPIENMIAVVREMARDPMKMHVKDRKEVKKETPAERFKHLLCGKPDGKKSETTLITSSIEKLGALLKLGLGEAGGIIIAENMKSEGFDPMIPGKRMHAAFGFCDIRQFTDATECLQTRVMMFTNQIGEIVHTACHQFSGAANKNIGDAFLIVWRLADATEKPDGVDGIGKPSGMKDVLPSPSVTRIIDNALGAFLKTRVEIDHSNDHGVLSMYKTDKDIIRRFPTGYSVRMGYGMHVGWAIEGAIGSRYKIDASYLSPNVNMSARLEAATKQFRCPLLMSHWFYNLLSPAAQGHCRRIDVVTVKGSEIPMGLYTYDITDLPDTIGEEPMDTFRFDVDPVFPALHKSVAAGFYDAFNAMVDSYVAGDWGAAKEHLAECKRMWPDDGPSSSLEDVMAAKDFVAPDGWAGYRALTEK